MKMALEQPLEAQTESPPICSPPEHFSIMDSIPTPSSSSTSLIAPSSPPFTASSQPSPPSASSSQFHLPSTPPSDIQSNNAIEQALADISISPNQSSEVDPQILEALKNKDRIYVLKLGELMEGLINDRSRTRIDLTPATSYQRLLVHRCSAYYRLSPESDPVTKSISVVTTLESRIPARRLCELVPAESSAQPAFQIMRRSGQERRSNRSQSQAGSVTGEDADFSDVEPSEAGSLGGRSNATGGSTKKRMTIEEREAAYNEARSRIFMDFEEKEKDKGKELAASSSSASLASGSASASTSAAGGSSLGDLDDSTSPTTESEWSGPSGPTSRDNKDVQRISGNDTSASSRSLRSSAPPFNANGQGSSRNSRAPSPAFTYANIYEPPPGPAFDLPQHPTQPGYHHPSQYHYPYMHSGQLPNPYIPLYPYYPQYNPYQHPPPPQPQGVSDSTSSSNGDIYSAPPHSGYGPPYGWSPYLHPPLQSPPHMQQPLPQPQLPPQQPHPNANHVVPPPPAPGPPYQQYMPPSHAYTYPIPGYYPPQHMEPPASHIGVQPMYDVPRSMNGTIMPAPLHNNSTSAMGRNDISNPSNHGRSPSKNPSSGGGGKARGVPPTRSPWSYGPGVSQNGHTPSVGGDAFGPRLNSARRQSGNSSTNSRSSINDDVSSTASSSTSSSSQRTYTSTSTSSQHPLPPRPDWAVGLKPQPTLHSTQGRHHDHSLSNSRTMSPPRSLNGAPSHSSVSRQTSSQQPVTLQSADFPPLISLPPGPEKRTPVAGGAWGNSPRSIHLPSPGQLISPANALVHHSNHSMGNNNGPESRLEESDRTFERPPPKSAELYNPKLLRRPTGGKVNGEKEKERPRGDAVAGAIQVDSMSLDDRSVENSSVAAPPNEALVMTT